ncbi:winged helix-turn-helix domain-containing protein [Streptacidiphilus sp. 4-A2]|nr:winged helix-turn-helix domain-containing protein [Streptacidiphilus sp. 4-A2]
MLGLRGPGICSASRPGWRAGRARRAVHGHPDPGAAAGPAALPALARARPGVARAVDQVVSRRLRESDQLRAAAAEPLPVRLAVLLLELCERYGEPGPGAGEVRINLPLSQDDLAGLLMTSRRTVSRALEQWRTLGWIATGRQTLLVRSVERLKEQAYGG